jgi:hypothetical protein
MSVLQGSGSTLESIIGSRPQVLREWESSGSFTEPLPVHLHAKFLGKSMADEEQKWRNAQSPTPVEGIRLGNERQGGYKPVDVSEEEDDVIEGCCFLELDNEELDISSIRIRAEYIRIYDALELCYQNAFKRGHQPSSLQDDQESVSLDVPLYYESS